MDRINRHWVPIGFAVSFLAVGVPFWSIPYTAVSLPSSVLEGGLAVVAAAALALRALDAARFWRIVAVVGSSVPAAVMARVQVEALRDPTSHNLWPFEIAIALGVGMTCAFLGALAGIAAATLGVRGDRGRVS